MNCLRCHSPIPAERLAHPGTPPAYCTKACRIAERYERKRGKTLALSKRKLAEAHVLRVETALKEGKSCKGCGKAFSREKLMGTRQTVIYCSRACSEKARAAATRRGQNKLNRKKSRARYEELIKNPPPCASCGEPIDVRPFAGRRPIYCSPECRPSHKPPSRRTELSPRNGLSPGTSGAASELRVAFDLLERGYAVFRSVSPNAPFDLVAVRDEELLRIEVRSGTRNGDHVSCTRKPSDTGDLYAAVCPDNSVEYIKF